MTHIREAGLSDVELIREIAHTVWPRAYGDILSAQQLDYMLDMFYSPASLTNQMTTLQHNFLIAEDIEGDPVGFASFSFHPVDKDISHLHKLYVLSEKQKLHAGRQLVNAVTEHLSTTEAKLIQLNVNRHNLAISFYRKMGFSIIREEDNDIGHGFFMNDYVMQKELKQ